MVAKTLDVQQNECMFTILNIALDRQSGGTVRSASITK